MASKLEEKRERWFNRIDKHFTKLVNSKNSNIDAYTYSTYEPEDTCEVIVDIFFSNGVSIKTIVDVAKYLKKDEFDIYSSGNNIRVSFYFEDIR